MKKAIFYTIIFAAIQIAIGAIVMAYWKFFTHEWPENNVTCTIVMEVIGDVIALALFLKLKWCEVSPNWIRTRPWAVLFWCAMMALGLLIPSQWLQEHMPNLPNYAEDMFAGLIATPWGYVVVGLAAPLVEEMVMRGAVLRALLKWSNDQWLCIAISATLFALLHMNPAQIPHAFLVGWLLGWLYYRTGSIIPGVIVHWVNNSVAFAIGHIMLAIDPASKGDITLLQMFGSDARVLMAVGFSLMIFLPAIYQLNIRMKKA